MDELKLLKKDWKKQEKNLPRLSYDELYQMIWKKSSSIVKWIFIISICEFLLGTILNIVLADDEYWNQMESYHLTGFTIGMYVISYLITFYFIYCFYRNYRRINATDSARLLMKNILKTRKTVKQYIAFILISSGFTFVIAVFMITKYHASTVGTVNEDMSFDFKQWLIFIGALVLILAAFLGVVWLVYRLIYGILLKRLQKNYKELKKLDV